jgi:intracellular sulfur oxidation DsrE/DsrF family protein
MDALPGQHRVFIDSATAHGGAEALLYTNNIYNAQENAYSGVAADFAMVVCFRHFSTPFGYSDAVWEKYGEGFHGLIQFPNPVTGKAPTVNLMNSTDVPGLPNFGVTIDTLVARGTQFAICNNATRFIAGQLAAGAGTSADDVYEELVAGAIPNSRFVSAGVMALTRAQEYGYSLLYAG